VQDKVFTVVLNFNGRRDTMACLSSLQHLHYDNHEVIVVDNGSTDDSCSRIQHEFPSVKIIATGKNLGFAGGCNVGIRHALREGAEFIWLLNNDTTVDCGALEALVETARGDSRIGAVGSAIYFMDDPDRIQAWGGGYVNFWLGRARHFLKPVSDSSIEFITGASLLISRRVFESVGLLDEEFFMYWEDADFCFRLRKANWRLAVAAQSKVWHKQCASVGQMSVRLDTYFNASAVRFFSRHAPIPLFSLWIGVLASIAKRVLRGDWERSRAIWKGAKTGKNALKKAGYLDLYPSTGFETDKSHL
jgi:GT2 family glycosyltransferase